MALGAPDGYFTDESAIRRLHRERPMMLMGPRFVIMQAAHPMLVAGLYAHMAAEKDPYVRLSRTTEVMTAIGFGSKADADRETAAVRAMHARIDGRLPDAIGPFPKGAPYRADDPKLLMWVLFSMVDSSLAIYKALIAPLARDDEAAYWEDMKIVGTLFGLEMSQMPATLADLDDYRRAVLASPDLAVSDWSRRRVREIVFDVPAPRFSRPAVSGGIFVASALLPERIRELFGFNRYPRTRQAVVRAVAGTSRAVYPRLPERLRHATPEAPESLTAPREQPRPPAVPAG
jgi:uncharacterized protein (DUF2236 family)